MSISAEAAVEGTVPETQFSKMLNAFANNSGFIVIYQGSSVGPLCPSFYVYDLVYVVGKWSHVVRTP